MSARIEEVPPPVGTMEFLVDGVPQARSYSRKIFTRRLGGEFRASGADVIPELNPGERAVYAYGSDVPTIVTSKKIRRERFGRPPQPERFDLAPPLAKPAAPLVTREHAGYLLFAKMAGRDAKPWPDLTHQARDYWIQRAEREA
jgi:hypothetical protein